MPNKILILIITEETILHKGFFYKKSDLVFSLILSRSFSLNTKRFHHKPIGFENRINTWWMKEIETSYQIIKYTEHHLPNSRLVSDDRNLIFAETSGLVGSRAF